MFGRIPVVAGRLAGFVDQYQSSIERAKLRDYAVVVLSIRRRILGTRIIRHFST